MGNLSIFAISLVGLICIQAVEVKTQDSRTDSSSRSDLLQRETESDTRCTQDGIVPIPGDCEHYLICRNGRSRTTRCPDNYFFDTISYCTPDDSADCGIPKPQPLQRDGISKEANVVEEFQCTENGRFADPNSCQNYIECTIQSGMVRTTYVSCPPNQDYNIETKQCDDECSAQCDQDLACACQWPHCLITCEEPNGVFPVPTNCRLYLQCTDSLPEVLRCREGKAFDPAKRACVNIEETNCVTASNDVLSIMRS